MNHQYDYTPLLYDDDEEIYQREEAINNIHKEMLDMNDIFKTLASISNEQGYLIDNIDSNIDSAVIHVEHAENELVIADNTQKKRNKCLWYILLILFVIINIVIIILVVTLK